jgi:hypothetical protein
MADTDVVDNVGNQKHSGHCKSGDHESLVDFHFAVSDGGVTARKKNGAGAI